jgi:molybdenum cofactor biosynthesis enzyme MoaA
MTNQQSKTFCVLPWMHLATSSTGNLRLCCNSIPNINLIRKEDGTPYKIYYDNIEEAWNSPMYKTIRKQMIDGERPEACARCFTEEDVGARSARQNFNNRWTYDGEITETADFNIKYLDIRLGNLCNLKCVMCNPYSSNQWTKEWKLIHPNFDENELSRLKALEWPTDEKVWTNLFSIADTVEEIYLTGGEPTIIKEQHRLLDFFIDSGKSNDITLKYNTNLTNIPAELLKKWKKFHTVRLNLSIDAYGVLNDYIRYPSKWKKIEENFNKIRKLDNAVIELHCTVQMYNILNLNEFINWALPFKHRIHFNILNHPKQLNIRALPENLKIVAEAKLKEYMHVPRIDEIIKYMNSKDLSYDYNHFVTYTNLLDRNRKLSFFSLVPEFNDAQM